MIDYDRALNDISSILDYNDTSSNQICFKMHKNTNEKLKEILGKYDFKNKNVLSVLSSSDQMISSYYLGARSVDTFDSNLTTFLFYYLKKWCMEYTKKEYLSSNNRELFDSLDLHKDNDVEENIALLWRRVLVSLNEPLTDSPLFFKQLLEYNVPYSEDISKTISLIKDVNPNYQDIDFFSEQEFKKKYDIIILSNMLEYAHDLGDKDLYEKVINNLLKALNDDGIIICSSIIYEKAFESDAFKEYFEFQPGAFLYEEYRDRYKPISYTYTKRRN